MRQGETKTKEPAIVQDICSQDKCDHRFSMKPLRAGLYYNQQTVTPFCPQYCRKTKLFENTWPQAFIDDKIHFPLFMLEVDRESTAKREKEFVEAHQTRIRNLEMSQKQILVPHPGKSKVICFVCKTHYTDYRRHIQTKKHKKKLNSSKMESSIKQLIRTVSKSEEIKEQISTSCNQQWSRMVSLKTEKSSIKPHLKLSKKQLKEIKLNQKEDQRLQAFSLDEAELQQVKDIEIKIQGSVNKGEDYRTTTNNLISVHSFRVSDYLI